MHLKMSSAKWRGLCPGGNELTEDMMTSSNGNISALLAICAGISPIPGESPHKGQWRGALMFSLICVWINGWVNNRKAGDLRRYRAHYDVIVMDKDSLILQSQFRNGQKARHFVWDIFKGILSWDPVFSFDSIFIEVSCHVSNWQYLMVDSNNGITSMDWTHCDPNQIEKYLSEHNAFCNINVPLDKTWLE